MVFRVMKENRHLPRLHGALSAPGSTVWKPLHQRNECTSLLFAGSFWRLPKWATKIPMNPLGTFTVEVLIIIERAMHVRACVGEKDPPIPRSSKILKGDKCNSAKRLPFLRASNCVSAGPDCIVRLWEGVSHVFFLLWIAAPEMHHKQDKLPKMSVLL